MGTPFLCYWWQLLVAYVLLKHSYFYSPYWLHWQLLQLRCIVLWHISLQLPTCTIIFFLKLIQCLHAHCSPCHCSIQDSENAQRSTCLVLTADTSHSSIVHIPSNWLEVIIHTAYEEYPMSQPNHFASCLGSDTQLTDKPHELCFNDNVEHCEGEKMSVSVEAAV